MYGHIYAAIVAATAVTHRPMLLNLCNFLQPGQFQPGNPNLTGSGFNSWALGPTVANSWRTDTDLGTPGHVSFTSVVRNMGSDALHPSAAGPGHWNDPDYLAPDQGMSTSQFQVQMSMWAMLAAPLMVSVDLSTIGPASLATIDNPNVIAIDQDPAGVQGQLIAQDGYAEVWDKPLSDGSRAVALLNLGYPNLTITATALGVGLGAAPSYTVTNVWTQAKSVTDNGTFSAKVSGNAVVLLRVSRNAATKSAVKAPAKVAPRASARGGRAAAVRRSAAA